MAVPSTSVLVSVPVAVGVPVLALATPPASVTAPVLVPAITAASLLPVMLNVAATLDVAVLSVTCTVKLSVTLWPAVSACVAAPALLSA